MNNDNSVWDIRDSLNQNFQRVLNALTAFEKGADVGPLLSISAELRQNIALAEKSYQSMRNAESQALFEQIVLDVIAEASPAMRKTILRRLNEREQFWRREFGGTRPPPS
jgi:hypothetical protein